MRKSFYILIILCLSVSIAYGGWFFTHITTGGGACSGTYGRTTGASATNAVALLMIVTKVTIDCSASAGSIIATLQHAHNSSHKIIFLIYDDDGTDGEPNTKIWSGDAMFDDATTSAYDDVTDTFSGLSLEAGDYWIGMLFESTDNETDYRYEASAGQARYYSAPTFAAVAEWDEDSDTHSTAERAVWLSF